MSRLPSDLMRPAAAAREVGRNRQTLAEAMKRGAVKRYERFGVVLVSLADVKTWASGKRNKPAGRPRKT